MSRDSFSWALDFVLDAEGGWYPGDEARDPNPTNHGITQKTYDRWRDVQGQSRQSVKKIGYDEVRSIYRVMYWTKGKCDDVARISPEVAAVHFDACVNHGVGSPHSDLSAGAAELLQRTVGVNDDGIIGPLTLGNLKAEVADDGGPAVARRYIKARLGQYEYLAKKSTRLAPNLPGWKNRMKHLTTFLSL